jgi:hypothetical protein
LAPLSIVANASGCSTAFSLKRKAWGKEVFRFAKKLNSPCIAGVKSRERRKNMRFVGAPQCGDRKIPGATPGEGNLILLNKQKA